MKFGLPRSHLAPLYPCHPRKVSVSRDLQTLVSQAVVALISFPGLGVLENAGCGIFFAFFPKICTEVPHPGIPGGSNPRHRFDPTPEMAWFSTPQIPGVTPEKKSGPQRHLTKTTSHALVRKADSLTPHKITLNMLFLPPFLTPQVSFGSNRCFLGGLISKET